MSQHLSDRVGLCLLVAVLAAPIGHAQNDQNPFLAALEGRVTVNYRDADIRAVARQLQTLLGRPILIDPRVSARITLLTRSPITPEEFHRLFLSAIEAHGLSAIESGDAIRIVPDANARAPQAN